MTQQLSPLIVALEIGQPLAPLDSNLKSFSRDASQEGQAARIQIATVVCVANFKLAGTTHKLFNTISRALVSVRRSRHLTTDHYDPVLQPFSPGKRLIRNQTIVATLPVEQTTRLFYAFNIDRPVGHQVKSPPGRM
jgi:hypothetical protein